MENKTENLRLVLPALQQTRSLCDPADLEYIQEQGIVLNVPIQSTRIKVMADSGIAMIKDVVEVLMYGKEQKNG